MITNNQKKFFLYYSKYKACLAFPDNYSLRVQTVSKRIEEGKSDN